LTVPSPPPCGPICRPRPSAASREGGWIHLPPCGRPLRLEAPAIAHARLSDDGRRDALAADPILRDLLWETFLPEEPLLLRRLGPLLAWGEVKDRVLGTVLGGAKAA